MNRQFTIVTGLALVALLSAGPLWAQRGGSGRGGGGGGISARSAGGGGSFRGGGSGLRMGGGASFRSGGSVRSTGPAMRGGGPSIRSGPTVRSAPSGAGASVRSSAGAAGGVRAPVRSDLSRPGPTFDRPTISSRPDSLRSAERTGSIDRLGSAMRRDVTPDAIRRAGAPDFRGFDAARRGGAADVTRANQIDRFLSGREGVRGGADFRQGVRVDMRPSWQTRTRGDRDLGRIDRNLDVAFRNSTRADGSLRGDTAIRQDVAAGSWLDRRPDRANHWADWGNNVKNNWDSHHHHSHFNDHFWALHNVFFPWGYGYYWHSPWPWWYWWGYPTWGSCLGWFPGWGWNSPYYYDYGYGGNVVYYGNGVYVNDQLVGTPAEYAESAAALAAVKEADISRQAGGEWLPLGTFALAADRSDTDPKRVVQLAVDKQGIVSGTMYDEATDKTFPIQGRVDRQTQRVAFTIGDNPDVVMETGLYNLTQDQTPVLVHTGKDKTETNLLIRLKQPAQTQTPQPPQPAPRGYER